MAAIFITKEIIPTNGENYGGIFKDRVARDVENNDLYIDVRGQWLGRRDYVITNAIDNNENIHIFSRNKSCNNFKYWGIAEYVYRDDRVAQLGIRPDTIRDLAYFHFIIKNENIINQEIHKNPAYTGYCCIKKSCMHRIGHTNPDKAALSQCFVKIE